MKKTTKILTALLAGLTVVILYVSCHLRIYSPPLVTLNGVASAAYHPINAYCASTPLPISPLPLKTLNLFVWNIHKGNDSGWARDLRHFAKTADLMLLQEATSEQNIATLFKTTFSTSFFASGFSYRNVASGVEILAKTTPDMYCAGVGQEPWLRIPKVVQALRFPLENGHSLLVVNVHLVNFEWTPNQYRQQLEMMMAHIAAHQGAVILAGDFNSWNSERLAIIRQHTTELGLREVSFENDQRLRFLGQPLDHIFVRGFAIKKAKAEAVKSSDHNPLQVQLEFVTTQQ